MKTRVSHGTLHLLDTENRLLIISALWKDYEYCKYYMAHYYTPQGGQPFYNTVLDLLQQGTYGHHEIYTRLVAMGLDEKLYELVCSSWDGLFAILNIQGEVMFQHAVSREFAYAPILLRSDLDACHREFVYRYLKGYSPVTLQDACCFSGWKKKGLEAILQGTHNVQMSSCSGSTVYKFPEKIGAYPRIPTTALLSGFDPLMLGYEKHENPFLPQRHLHRVFNLWGIVYPYFSYEGNVARCWKLEKETLQLQSFEDPDALQRQQVEKTAKRPLQPVRIIWADFQKMLASKR